VTGPSSPSPAAASAGVVRPAGTRPRVFSGMQPSGAIHLGNLLGALTSWVALQDEADCVYSVVDLHAITAPDEHDPETLRRRTVELATTLFAVGVDPARSVLFVQSHVREHSELAWLLNCVATFGELGRMPQFKEKSAGRDASVSVGLFDYPVLQTADILLYHADKVPVGEDQRHHIELARDIGQRFNHRFGEVFTLPSAILPPVAARVMDLQEPTRKMSKSATSEKGLVHVLDDPDRVLAKFRSAVTDSDGEVRLDRAAKPGVTNLLEILAAVTGRSAQDAAEAHAGDGYGVLKSTVAEAVDEFLRPIRSRHAQLAADPAEVERLLASGAERARAVAGPTYQRARDAMGLLAPA
jgi:tryptophanyl-tRNA synthetase